MKMHSGSRVACLVCFLVALRVFAEPAHNGSPATSKGVVPTGTRTLRIAIVQMRSVDHDIDGNLKRASEFAEKAAARGAKLVLVAGVRVLPERNSQTCAPSALR
jgi:hypothetical protein